MIMIVKAVIKNKQTYLYECYWRSYFRVSPSHSLPTEDHMQVSQ